jgi:hypothetical protein
MAIPSADPKMRRLTLKEPVSIKGTSPIALGSGPQGIEMRPLSLSDGQKTKSKNGTGWYWETSDGTLVPIDMSMVHETEETLGGGLPAIKLHPRHYLYFQKGNERLNCVEHILALKTLGLDGVVIKALNDSTWVPYDGRAKMYWEAIESHLKYDGVLKPSALQVKDTYTDIDKKHGWTRSVTLDSSHGRDELVVKVRVDYKNFGGEKIIERRFPIDDPSSMVDVLFSRSLMQPRWLESLLPLIKEMGWPHADNLLKPSEFDPQNPEPYLNEIALHRMLDFLGAMALLAEAGTFVSGGLETNRGNHFTDLAFLRQLKATAREMCPDMESLAPLGPASRQATGFRGRVRQDNSGAAKT